MWADEPRTDEVRIGWRGVVGSRWPERNLKRKASEGNQRGALATRNPM